METLAYPIAVFFIIVNEFCERFASYGLRTVLTLYFRNVLLFEESLSTALYHAYMTLCYSTPVLGAVLADTVIGKYWTILYGNIVYASGSILLSAAAIPDHLPQVSFSLMGLFIIALGTGGIKPCISAFGGDQFVRPRQEKQLEQFFSVYFFFISCGSLIATFVTPILRQDVDCFGGDTCFSLAFGLPSVLMLIAVVVFVMGKRRYRIAEPERNMMGPFIKCIAHGIRRKLQNQEKPPNHWLDLASDKFDPQLIDDIKRVLQVSIVFIPLPVFWALYDQQASRWTFQATRMDGSLGSIFIKPDQMQIFNPLLILLTVPLYESLNRFDRVLTPLRRIGIGLVLCCLSFVVSGIVELHLEPTYPRIPGPGSTQLNFVNTLPCRVDLDLTWVNETQKKSIQINASSYSFQYDLPDEWIDVEARLSSPSCDNFKYSKTAWSGQLKGHSKKGYSVLISGGSGTFGLTKIEEEEPLEKSSSGQPRLRFILNDFYTNKSRGELLTIKSDELRYRFKLFNASSERLHLKFTDVKDVEPAKYDVFVTGRDGTVLQASQIKVDQGGCYTAVVQSESTSLSTKDKLETIQMEVTRANSVPILWLVPQFVLITVAEVFFSVAGLSFSFTQAPARMNSIMQAIWALIVAVGNVLVIIVAQLEVINRQATEFFIFAGAMAAASLIFAVLATRYAYVEIPSTKVVAKQEKEDNI